MTETKEQEVMEVEELRVPMSIGKIFAESGLFPDIKSQAQAVVKILAGKELGLSPFQSMKNIYLVGGKLAIMANALAAIIKNGNKYDYRIDSLTDQECKIMFLKIKGDKTEEIGISEFNFKDAAKAGLANKDNYKSYPKNMMFARALTNGVHFYCPDAAISWNTYEELDEWQTIPVKQTIELMESGEVVDGTA